MLLLLGLRWGRAAFATDYPPDIQQALRDLPQPAFSRAERIRSAFIGPAFLLALLGAVVWATWQRLNANPAYGFGQAYLMALAVFAAFAVIDLLFVDWLVICRLRPAGIVIPGTEGCAGWSDYRFHLREQFSVKGLAALVVVPALVAGVVVLLH